MLIRLKNKELNTGIIAHFEVEWPREYGWGQSSKIGVLNLIIIIIVLSVVGYNGVQIIQFIHAIKARSTTIAFNLVLSTIHTCRMLLGGED